MNCPVLLGFQWSDADLHLMRICSVILWLCMARMFAHLVNILLIKIPFLLLIKALAFTQAQTYLGKPFQLCSVTRLGQHPSPTWLLLWYCCLSCQPRSLEHLCGSSFIPCQSYCLFLLLPSALQPAVLLPSAGTHDGCCHVVWVWGRLAVFPTASWNQLSFQSILGLCVVTVSFILVPLPG